MSFHHFPSNLKEKLTRKGGGAGFTLPLLEILRG
jgi:hypothetical protein